MNCLERGMAPNSIEELTHGRTVEMGSCNIGASIFDFGDIKYVALTSFDGVTPMGMCDFRYIGDMKNAVIESPMSVRRPDLTVPAIHLRAMAGSDGIYIEEGYRGKGIGSILMDTSMQIARNFGAERLIVNQPNRRRNHWLKQLGGEKYLGAFVFHLR